MPVVTHSGDVSPLEPTTSMVLRSQTRGGRSSASIPDVEVRPETEFRQEPEIGNSPKIEVPVSTICEWDLGATGPITAEKPSEIAETISKYVSGDRLRLETAVTNINVKNCKFKT